MQKTISNEDIKEMHLKELIPFLQKTHLKLDLIFLNELLQNASKSDKPHKDKKFARKIGCPFNKDVKTATTIYGWMMGYRTVLFSKLIRIIDLSDYDWKDIENNMLSIKAGIKYGEILPTFPIKIDEKLGSIIGHILGDGSIDKTHNQIFYCNSNMELIEEFKKNMKQIFSIEPRMHLKKNNYENNSRWIGRITNLNNVPKKHTVGLFYPKICSLILYALIGKFAEGKIKKITPQMISSNNDFKKGLIKAFFDDEGSIRSEDGIAKLYQDNKKLLEQIRLLMIHLGVKPRKIRSYMKKDKLRYYFNISEFREYYLFYHTIGCTSSKKKKEFELLINRVQNSKYFKKKFSL